MQAIERLRSDVVPEALAGSGAETYVTGETAEIVDYNELMSAWLPVVFVFVLGLSFILLTVAFRSLVVPAKAIVLNLLSVGAAYGLIVLVFQKGVGNELFGFETVDAIEAWLPLTYALNAVNRSMGAHDLYPFVLAPKVLGKLRFVHDLVQAHIPYRTPDEAVAPASA